MANDQRRLAEDWHPEDVKAAIRKTGISLAALAVQNGFTPSSFRKTLVRKSAGVQALMARHLGVTPQTIWPSRYDDLGQPIDHRRSAPAIITRSDRATRTQKSRAA